MLCTSQAVTLNTTKSESCMCGGCGGAGIPAAGVIRRASHSSLGVMKQCCGADTHSSSMVTALSHTSLSLCPSLSHTKPLPHCVTHVGVAPTVVCNEWKPECRQVISETRLVDPAAPGADPSAYATTATAACQLLGYSSFGAGTMHTTGEAIRGGRWVGGSGVETGECSNGGQHLW